uniref:Uncharacterized protein n=1 Tax=Anguilla anguilla TaxID=7936 RepID=A0A0E9WKK4_ANGAN
MNAPILYDVFEPCFYSLSSNIPSYMNFGIVTTCTLLLYKRLKHRHFYIVKQHIFTSE